MNFTIQVWVNTQDKKVKDKCIERLSEYLNALGYDYDVGYNPNEIDKDLIAKA